MMFITTYDTTGNVGAVYRAALDGTGLRQIASNSSPGVAVDNNNNTICWDSDGK